ncbi:hypothetical protein [Nocardioides sp. SR21]|uniref:hypothetical protein n=1 Tax=Nocardioides sp. SR21 TaxID=2919501 RepID=UPI001FA9C2CF|nr:hypothetical protein [Nocardioides sp. SR21]
MNLQMRRRRSEEPEVVEEPELMEVVEEPTDDSSTTVRALRAQVRVLEQALEVAPDVPVLAGDEAAYRRRVLLAVRAVAARADDHDDPRHAAARVVAAVERLDVDGFARPVLPGIATHIIAPPPQLPAGVRTAAIASAPAPEPAPEPVVDLEPGDEVVLPVPPPAREESRRGKRRQRHHTAA